jgi:hypothetical protein
MDPGADNSSEFAEGFHCWLVVVSFRVIVVVVVVEVLLVVSRIRSFSRRILL